MAYQNHRLAPASVMEPTTAKYLLDFLYFTRDDEQFRFYKKSRCSIFRGVILCLCMNLTYANVVRFPRELERHGIGFLVPYLVLMLIIGLPIVLLEIALGQFLGQGSAHSWKASPLFKGASIVGRLGSWLGGIWISMQMSLALLYIGQLSFSSVPFKACPSTSTIIDSTRYQEIFVSGQMCLQRTFLRPVWEHSINFGLLAIGLVFLWVIIMMCTHSSRINRRSIFMFGFITIGLLLFQAGWQITSTFHKQLHPEMWPFRLEIFHQSSTWFNALVQVIMSTNIGVGVIPVMTGKFLYKGDAVRTCAVYICFNLLICIVATAFYMTTFGTLNLSHHVAPLFVDLTTITSIYDRAFAEPEHSYLRSLIPSLAFLMIIFAGVVSVSMAVYTSSRLLKRHPNYIMCLVGMFLSIGFLIGSDFTISRHLDLRWTGAVIIVALIFDVISIAWVYGVKNLYNDLEFSVGRPIWKFWLVMWIVTPLILSGILVWWCVSPSAIDPLPNIVPRWVPIVICLAIIFVVSAHAVFKQMDYNFFSMVHEATRPAKDWGPADPLVRHAWKQWKSVCDDTGERDFTLRRRGTKDWTNSIKKGQYSHATRNNNNNNNNQINSKYHMSGKLNGNGIHHHQTSTPTGGSNSPNYSGSMFGDSAIEEDISCDKYPASQLDFVPHHDHRESRSRKSSNNTTNSNYKRQPSDASSHQHQRNAYLYHQRHHETDDYNLRVPIRIPSTCRKDNNNYKSRIEIMPSESQFQPMQSTFNPLSHFHHDNFSAPFGNSDYQYHNSHHVHPQQPQPPMPPVRGHLINNIHIDSSEGSASTKTTNTRTTHEYEPFAWRKMPSKDADEFSTEL